MDKRKLMQLYNNRCGRCLVRPATGVHEIEPKSLRPTTWDEPENQIPLCAECHELVQGHTDWYAPSLRAAQDRADQIFHWRKHIDTKDAA